MTSQHRQAKPVPLGEELQLLQQARQRAFREAAQHLDSIAAYYEQMSSQVEKNSERNRWRVCAGVLREQAKAIREKV